MKVKWAYPDEQAAEAPVFFICPGCKLYHVIPTKGPRAWGFNGDLDRPTLTPSILARGGSDICHSFVTDGEIKFLDDCTHELKGQIVILPELKDV